MPLETWVTQPPKPFDSFYFFDTDTLHFVRIRLELGRKDDNPDPGVFARRSRYVGFVDDTKEYDFKNYERWSVNRENKIVYRVDEFNSKILSNRPEAGKKVIDFSLTEGQAHPSFVHHGNRIAANNYRLPSNSDGKPVTEVMLKTIALSVMGRTTVIILCLASSNATELADAIYQLYNEIIAVPA